MGALLVVSSLLGCSSSGARSARAVTRCRISQLVVSLGPYVSEATEQHTLALRLVNRGKHACTLYAYPRVTLYDAHGLIPFRIGHGGDQMIPLRPPKPVGLEPGREAFLLLNKNTCVNGSLRGATMIKISTPRVAGTGAALFRFPRRMAFPWRVPDSCTDAADLGSIITVSSFVPTLRAALSG